MRLPSATGMRALQPADAQPPTRSLSSTVHALNYSSGRKKRHSYAEGHPFDRGSASFLQAVRFARAARYCRCLRSRWSPGAQPWAEAAGAAPRARDAPGSGKAGHERPSADTCANPNAADAGWRVLSKFGFLPADSPRAGAALCVPFSLYHA